jgi:hypothetical protein
MTAVVCLLGGDAALAQGKASISKLAFDDLQSPDLGGTKAKSWKQKDWLEVEAGITIPAMSKEIQEAGYVDRVVVKWYVAVKEKTSGKPMLLTKDITHINVPVDEEFFSSVYLSPNTIKRLTGKDRAGKSSVEVVAVELLINGVKVAEETSSMKSGWWNSPSLSRGDRYPLLDKNETPFKVYWWDRYAEIEERR